jgi:glycosyltransferase involved in cell wall biosynthesis
MRPRVLCFVSQYPQLSETYIETELAALSRDHDLCVVARHGPRSAGASYREHFPYQLAPDQEALRPIIEQFRPQVLHGHWLTMLKSLHQVARLHDIPFTVRAHSFDTLAPADEGRVTRGLREATSDELCLGVLAFPCSRPFLESQGVPPHKIRDCYPVVDVRRFLDRSPNGADVMNVGACLPKKRMEDFVALSAMVPSRRFRLYAVSYNRAHLRAYATFAGSEVEFAEPVEPAAMPAEYKRHAWLVYTGCFERRSIGWPVAVAEAQASGVGVILAGVRPDLSQYLGGAGFLYRDLNEVPALLAGPVPDEVRQLGFEVAGRSDIHRHLHLLTDLWASAGISPAPIEAPGPGTTTSPPS